MIETYIRSATAADAAVLAALAERTFRDTFAAVNTAENMAAHAVASYGADKQRAEIESERIRTLLVECDGGIAGYAQLRIASTPECVKADRAVELWRFYIDRDWIGRGLAQRLMDAALAEAAALDAHMLWLGVWEHNPRAIAFYRKCGFVQVGAHVFRLGDDAQTDLIMRRMISETGNFKSRDCNVLCPPPFCCAREFHNDCPLRYAARTSGNSGETMNTLLRAGLLASGLLSVLALPSISLAETTAQAMPETMDMLRHAIAMQTVQGKGQVPEFAQYLARKLQSAGFAKSDITIIPVGETAALTVRYPGSDKSLKPILISGHMDVVAANPADWTRDPFTLVEENGYLYGRGVADMKTGVVALVETFMRLKREGFAPKRELVLVFSGDEETGMISTRELAKRHHDAEFLLNADGGGGIYDTNLKPVTFEIQAAEKTYADLLLTVTSAGGHSSEPDPPKNAIYHLARALERIAAYQFPVQHNDITLASFKALGAHETGPLATAIRAFAANPDDAKAAAAISADPAYVGQIRTTCVATMLDGGHARNALPQRADANINCRIFPGTPVAAIKDALEKVIADPTVSITVREPLPVGSAASPLRADLMGAIAETIHERFPGVEVVPGMAAYATDSVHFRAAGVPSFGVAPEFTKPNDTFAHGLNEKLPATEVPAALDYWHSLLTRLAK